MDTLTSSPVLFGLNNSFADHMIYCFQLYLSHTYLILVLCLHMLFGVVVHRNFFLAFHAFVGGGGGGGVPLFFGFYICLCMMSSQLQLSHIHGPMI